MMKAGADFIILPRSKITYLPYGISTSDDCDDFHCGTDSSLSEYDHVDIADISDESILIHHKWSQWWCFEHFNHSRGMQYNGCDGMVSRNPLLK